MAWLHGSSRRSLMDTTNPEPLEVGDTTGRGTKDGSTAADHDESYRFGLHPSAIAPFPFTERQFARLLILRGRLHAMASPIEQWVA
jgi:hypothetical protein